MSNAAVKMLVSTEKPNKPAIVMIHLVSQSSVAVRIQAHHPIEIDRGSIRVHDAAPCHLDTVLAVGDPRVVSSNQLRSLRDQKIETSSCVVNVSL